MEKIKKRIANLKVEGKLKVYQMTVQIGRASCRERV